MLESGERIDEWVVDGPLGAGGTASVYRAHNANAPRIKAALKVLDAGALFRPDSRARLAREGEVLHELDHPGIVRVHGVRPDASPPYLVMHLVEGERLSTRIQTGGARSADEALPLLEALAEAVAYLHARNIQHRDIKPANILLRDDGSPVLVDFGLVLEAGASRLTADGLAMGTVSYVPPEWANPTAIDPVKWDVYSLGAVFWEVLVGRRAFPLADDMDPTAAALQLMSRKRTHPALDPGPDAPFFLRMLIREMTAPDPAARPSDAGEVLARLQAGEEGGVVDPVDLFRTPMPAWQQDESAPTLDRLATSKVPAPPEALDTGGVERPKWLVSFLWGAALGGLITLVLLAAAAGWFLGSHLGTEEAEPVTVEVPEEPVEAAPSPTVEPAPSPAPTALPAPEPADVVPPVAPGGPAPSPGPGQVSARAFGAWVEAHPEWSVEAARAAGLADADYLHGWAVEPPPGPATRVSWYAAQAYCKPHGGLPALDDPPLRWATDSGAAAMEWRAGPDGPAWRAWDDRTADQVDPASTTHATGFRCKQGS